MRGSATSRLNNNPPVCLTALDDNCKRKKHCFRLLVSRHHCDFQHKQFPFTADKQEANQPTTDLPPTDWLALLSRQNLVNWWGRWCHQHCWSDGDDGNSPSSPFPRLEMNRFFKYSKVPNIDLWKWVSRVVIDSSVSLARIRMAIKRSASVELNHVNVAWEDMHERWNGIKFRFCERRKSNQQQRKLIILQTSARDATAP